MLNMPLDILFEVSTSIYSSCTVFRDVLFPSEDYRLLGRVLVHVQDATYATRLPDL